MKRSLFRVIIITMTGLLLMPGLMNAQSEQTTAANPPVAQPLVREGDFAVKLVEALKLGTAASETEAESMLGSVGIAPRNGWIADYPVTPDIIGELQKAVSDAADSKRLSMEKDEALKGFQDITTEANLSVTPYAQGGTVENPEGYKNYPDPTVINNYYYNEGPPVVTYYSPPPNYYYLYSWIPYPFWWRGFWFSGFYCLVDFHRVAIINRRVEVISNHFVDHRTNGVFRIDPLRRFNGRTFAGIGLPPGRRGFVSPRVQGGSRRIFSGSRERAIFRPGTDPGRRYMSPSGGGRTYAPPSGRGRTIVPPSGVSRPTSPPAGGGRTVSPPSGERGSIERGQRR